MYLFCTSAVWSISGLVCFLKVLVPQKCRYRETLHFYNSKGIMKLWCVTEIHKNMNNYLVSSWSEITHFHLKAFSHLFFGIFGFEKDDNVIEPFFRIGNMELVFCKCQEVVGLFFFFTIRRPVNEFSFVNMFLTLIGMMNILGFPENQPYLSVEFSSVFFPP